MPKNDATAYNTNVYINNTSRRQYKNKPNSNPKKANDLRLSSPHVVGGDPEKLIMQNKANFAPAKNRHVRTYPEPHKQGQEQIMQNKANYHNRKDSEHGQCSFAQHHQPLKPRFCFDPAHSFDYPQPACCKG